MKWESMSGRKRGWHLGSLEDALITLRNSLWALGNTVGLTISDSSEVRGNGLQNVSHLPHTLLLSRIA